MRRTESSGNLSVPAVRSTSPPISVTRINCLKHLKELKLCFTWLLLIPQSTISSFIIQLMYKVQELFSRFISCELFIRGSVLGKRRGSSIWAQACQQTLL